MASSDMRSSVPVYADVGDRDRSYSYDVGKYSGLAANCSGAVDAPLTVLLVTNFQIESIVECLRRNRQKYADLHRFRFCEYSGAQVDRLFPGAHARWARYSAVLDQLDVTEYVMWMDADAFINNMSISAYKYAEAILSKHGVHKSVIWSADYHGNSMINSGCFIAKATQWTKDFLREVYSKSQNWGLMIDGDQANIIRVSQQEEWHWHDHSYVAPLGELQVVGYKPFHVKHVSPQVLRNVFVAHLAGGWYDKNKYTRLLEYMGCDSSELDKLKNLNISLVNVTLVHGTREPSDMQ